MNNLTTGQRRAAASREVVTHLKRLGHASNAADVIRELESLRPSLLPRYRLSELALPSLTALAEAHLRERLEPARDPLTGTLDARSFTELWRAHARLVSAAKDDREAIAIAVRLCSQVDPAQDRHVAAQLRTLANTCVDAVAADDYVGRIGPDTIGVLARNGGLRGARIVAARLAQSCKEAFHDPQVFVRIEIELRDLAGTVRERIVHLAGAQT